jgi:hypothetical protein
MPGEGSATEPSDRRSIQIPADVGGLVGLVDLPLVGGMCLIGRFRKRMFGPIEDRKPKIISTIQSNMRIPVLYQIDATN